MKSGRNPISNETNWTDEPIVIPSERWMPEQSMQMKMPYVTEDHVGFLQPQSKHI